MMRFTAAVRTLVSSGLVSLLVACGGGGGGDGGSNALVYPNDGDVVVVSGTSATPAGTYKVNPSAEEASRESAANGRTVEYAYFETANFKFSVIFLVDTPDKYVVFFTDDSEDFVCRSPRLTNAEFGQLVGEAVYDLEPCGAGLTIDARAHRVKASNVVIKALNNPASHINVSANVGWTLQ